MFALAYIDKNDDDGTQMCERRPYVYSRRLSTLICWHIPWPRKKKYYVASFISVNVWQRTLALLTGGAEEKIARPRPAVAHAETQQCILHRQRQQTHVFQRILVHCYQRNKPERKDISFIHHSSFINHQTSIAYTWRHSLWTIIFYAQLIKQN